jgi:hypothetical protein
MTYRPNEDFIFQEVKLFIEGVQVAYEMIQVNSGIGTLPSANIVLPPYPGLMDICRYYKPKVHIFFVDPLDGEEKILFNGLIASTNFSRSRQSGIASISFSCVHKNSLMNEVLIDFTNPVANTLVMDAAAQPLDSANTMNTFSSTLAIITALKGIVTTPGGKFAVDKEHAEDIRKGVEDKQTVTDPSFLAEKWESLGYENRFKGFPGVIMNLWNQLKLNSVINPRDFESLVMYTILIEDGIKYFDRIGGHYFIEEAMDRGKMDPCTDRGKGKDQILVPPSLRLYVQSAVQTDTAIMLLQQSIGFSGELTDFNSLFYKVLERIDYEVITLTSPAETRLDPKLEWNEDNSQALETIIKPQIPFYISPNCNIYYPSMYHSLNVSQQEDAIPTRITLTSQSLPYSGANLHKKYRAPASVREAIAAAYAADADLGNADRKETLEKEKRDLEAGNLLSTTDGLKNRTKLGTFEWGRGVKHHRYELPYWLAAYGMSVRDKATEKEILPIAEDEKAALELLREAWNYRYGVNKTHLNPYDPSSGIWPHERLLFAAADYQFTKEVASSRAGSLDGVFNPYIIPGYPMDILDNSPVNPCFHAVCTSVTHTITSNSISTSVYFAAALTYSELANYYMQFVNPWLQVHLKIVAKRTTQNGLTEYANSIVNNEEARKIAEEDFYFPTLGVGSLAPDELYNFEKGTLRPISITVDTLSGKNRELNPMLTTQGNLALVARPIESRGDIEKRFDLTFIDMEENNYNQNIIRYADTMLAESRQLEPGQSQFLTYHKLPVEFEPDP